MVHNVAAGDHCYLLITYIHMHMYMRPHAYAHTCTCTCACHSTDIGKDIYYTWSFVVLVSYGVADPTIRPYLFKNPKIRSDFVSKSESDIEILRSKGIVLQPKWFV